MIARTVSDVALFNALFSDCQEAYPDVELKGLRVGYPTNFWADLGEEVSAPALVSFPACCCVMPQCRGCGRTLHIAACPLCCDIAAGVMQM